MKELENNVIKLFGHSGKVTYCLANKKGNACILLNIGRNDIANNKDIITLIGNKCEELFNNNDIRQILIKDFVLKSRKNKKKYICIIYVDIKYVFLSVV